MPVNNFQFVSKIFLLRFARRQMTLSAKISNFKASLDVVLVFEAAVKRGGDTTFSSSFRDLIPLGIRRGVLKTNSAEAASVEQSSYFRMSD